jgi:hypothetical protein
MTDKTIEQEIQAKGLTAPHITLADIEANIREEYYFTADDGMTGISYKRQEEVVFPSAFAAITFCVLVLNNGTKIVGINYGPVSMENFSADKGREEARQNAVAMVFCLHSETAPQKRQNSLPTNSASSKRRPNWTPSSAT